MSNENTSPPPEYDVIVVGFGAAGAGGGTVEQRAGGYDDTPENMFAYLESEVGDAVTSDTLKRFCAQSPEMIEWLKAQGVEFRGSQVSTYKTSYPTDDFYLYYSGNEKASARSVGAK
ncbi:hypothetical protein AWC31_23015 [Mycolicibacterium wolinskyi]|uniref:Uncharacterized protein n=1 Tax=Mycolicibacterium wolinskyi TaxID=59750 RepID=A0A1X2FBU4_9MYCO|nr:hypothetical protein AWC31_23015 [Mycolicibacterium wolinskyi]